MTDAKITVDEGKLHALARAEVERLTKKGAEFDRKLLKYNDIVETGIRYARCGNDPAKDQDIAESGVLNAVAACVRSDPLYLPRQSVKSLVYDWMIAR